LLSPDADFDLAPHLAAIQTELAAFGFDFEVERKGKSKRFAEINFEAARADVRPFIRDAEELTFWGREFFDGLLPRLTTEGSAPIQLVPWISIDWVLASRAILFGSKGIFWSS
jgi:hypothetical protein